MVFKEVVGPWGIGFLLSNPSANAAFGSVGDDGEADDVGHGTISVMLNPNVTVVVVYLFNQLSTFTAAHKKLTWHLRRQSWSYSRYNEMYR